MKATVLDVPFSVRRGSDEITTSRDRLDVAVIHAFLTDSYWSPGIPRETVERALDGSLNFGLYRENFGKCAQIGFARCGFTPLARPERFMEITRPDIYRTGSD